MNKIEKFHRKLSDQQQMVLILAMDQIRKDYSVLPDVRSIVGKRNMYRVRVGSHRIIFQLLEGGDIVFLYVGRRDDQTYRNL